MQANKNAFDVLHPPASQEGHQNAAQLTITLEYERVETISGNSRERMYAGR